jgi:hypothetical protein
MEWHSDRYDWVCQREPAECRTPTGYRMGFLAPRDCRWGALVGRVARNALACSTIVCLM